MDDNLKFQQMQDEMSRFEAEISAPPRPPIGANTYNTVAQRLEQPQHLPPPPAFSSPTAPPLNMMFRGIPPPPPPPVLLMPPQVRARLGGPAFGTMPPAFPMPPAAPPKPQPAVLSGAPQLYKNKPEKKNKRENSFKEISSEQKHPEPSMPISTATPTVTPSSISSESTVTPHVPAPQENHQTPAATHKGGKKDKKNKKAVRTAGGQVWEDHTLLEWTDDDFRLFCGDLGNDVTDELLVRTFSKYNSFIKAKVIRDKRTNKSKGFGFISFKEPSDFIKAMKEMNGRYVGSRPIKLRKSTWKTRSLDQVRKKEKEKAALISLLTGGSNKQ